MAYIPNLKHNFTGIAMLETWIKYMNVVVYSIDGYSHVYDYRHERAGGGVSLFMKEGIEYVRRNDLSVFNQDIESLFVEMTNVRSSCDKSIIVGVIYRSPDKDVHEFTLTMCSILEKLKTEKKAIYLSGDCNINLLNADKHVPTSEFVDTMFSYFVYPFINRLAGSVKESATLIDKIYSNMIKNDILTAIFYTDISDHFPVFYIDYSISVQHKPVHVMMRQYTGNSIAKYTQKLNMIDISGIPACDDPQLAFSIFYKSYTKIYYQCFLMRKPEINYRSKKPWLTDELKNSIKLYVNKALCIISEMSNCSRYEQIKRIQINIE